MANKRRRLVGRVVSDKMDKTVVVAIDISKPHPIYRKVVRTVNKVYAHDESNAIPVGTVVRLVESKPLSKLKRWVVEEVVRDTGDRVIEPVAMEAQDEAEVEAIAEELAPHAPDAESEASDDDGDEAEDQES